MSISTVIGYRKLEENNRNITQHYSKLCLKAITYFF